MSFLHGSSVFEPLAGVPVLLPGGSPAPPGLSYAIHETLF